MPGYIKIHQSCHVGHTPLALFRLANGFGLLSATKELGPRHEQSGLLSPQHVEPSTCGGGEARQEKQGPNPNGLQEAAHTLEAPAGAQQVLG